MVLLSTGGVCCVVVGVGLTAVVMLGTRGVCCFVLLLLFLILKSSGNERWSGFRWSVLLNVFFCF